jgi:hypothetical protein
MATLDHPSFNQPVDPGISLWRYMDLSKYAALLQKEALAFARVDCLGDPFEGSVPLGNIGFLDHVRKLRKEKPDDDPYPGLTDEQFEFMVEQYSAARRRMTQSAYVSCWHMNEAESAAMWKLYSRSSDAVCIRTDYLTLARHLSDNIFIGTVRYLDFKKDAIDPNSAFNALVVKRRSFAHEREARAIFWDSSGKHAGSDIVHIPIDLSTVVQSVHVSPEAPNWFLDVVIGITCKYGLQAPVEHSEINATPLF